MTVQSSSDSYKVTLFRRETKISVQKVLGLIILVSVFLRLFSAIYQGNEISTLPGIYDQVSYDGLARRVLQGYGFSFAENHWPATRGGEPTAHWSYLYTVYLVVVYKIFGVYPVIARLIQAILTGILQTWFTWRIGRRLFGQKVGLIAASLSAVYIYFFYYAGGLITEPFYIVGILWIFDSSFRIVGWRKEKGKVPRWWNWLELGVAVSVTVLLRQLFLLLVPIIFLWIWWNYDERPLQEPEGQAGHVYSLNISALKGLFLAGMILVLMILPWTIRNYKAFGTFVVLNTNAGFAFYWGNHPIHGTHFMPLLPGGEESYRSIIPPELLVLNEGQLDKALLVEGLRIVANDPIRYILLSLSRIEEYIRFWPSRDSGLLSNISRVGSFGILLPFMIWGLYISTGSFRKPSYPGQRSQLFIIYMFFMIYTLIHLLSWTLIRYRLPLDGFLVIFAALGIDNIARKIPFFRASSPIHQYGMKDN
jgi:hypothetical protein